MSKTTPIRIANPSDFEQLAEVMFDAVRNGPSAYTLEQRQAWVPEVRRGPAWEERLCNQTIFVAEFDRKIVGFISLSTGGYIDLAFVASAHQGTGVLRKLYVQLETAARRNGEHKLWVHASLMARPAFAAMGFRIVEEQLVEVKGQTLKRFEMIKQL